MPICAGAGGFQSLPRKKALERPSRPGNLPISIYLHSDSPSPNVGVEIGKTTEIFCVFVKSSQLNPLPYPSASYTWAHEPQRNQMNHYSQTSTDASVKAMSYLRSYGG